MKRLFCPLLSIRTSEPGSTLKEVYVFYKPETVELDGSRSSWNIRWASQGSRETQVPHRHFLFISIQLQDDSLDPLHITCGQRIASPGSG